jgi:carbamoyl-phosphate synthase large subunit
MRRTALVLDGSHGPALATVRSLGRAGWRVLTPAGTRSASSRYAARVLEIPLAEDDPAGFVERVAAVLDEEHVDVVVPATDASVELLWELDDARILGGDRASYELASDKARMLAAADAAGFGTPRWMAPASVEEARAWDEFPCVVKPRRSYVREGGRLRQRRHRIAEDAAQLEQALLEYADPALVQEFVPGRSLAVSVVLRGGRLHALVARETLTFDPIRGGCSVWKRTVPPDDVAVRKAVDLLRSVGYEGLGELEYQVAADGVERLMEVNVRVHGWVTLAVAAGVDLPLIAARALLGDELPDAPPYRAGVEMRWPAGELGRVLQALRRDAALPPGTTRLGVAAGLWPPWRPGMRYDGVELGDLAPFLPAPLRRRTQRRSRGPVKAVPSTKRESGPKRPSAA